MARALVIVGVLYLSSVAVAGVLDARNDESKGKDPEKKPVNIVKDYVCLRDGELCHPDHARNRGLYVSCSNGVAWEQQCPKCSYHPLNCPTRTLWFDGEKCDWASPKLASQPCLDRFPGYDVVEKEVGNALSEKDSLLESLKVPQLTGMKEPADINKWPANPVSLTVPMYFKSPKYEEIKREPVKEVDAPSTDELKESKTASDDENTSAAESDEDDSEEEDNTNQVESRKSTGEENESESEFPAYLNADDSLVAARIVKLSDPVYALVNNPDGSGKQVLMRISQPFVLEESARSGLSLPSLNLISSFAEKE